MSHENPQSRNEAILQNILGESNPLFPPQSRNEEILQSILYDTPYTKEPLSRFEELLLAIKNGGTYDKEAQSRNEAILLAKLNGEEYTEDPQSPFEELLIEWLHQVPTGVLKRVQGAVVSVSDALAKAAESLTIGINPIQSGSGDPSPENIRPISGWTGAIITHTGINLLDTSRVELGTFNQTTGEPISGSGNQQRTTYSIKVNAGDKVIQTNAKSENNRVFFYKGNTYVSTALLANGSAVTVPQGADCMKVASSGSGYTGSSAPAWSHIEFGNIATEHQAYQGNTLSVSWQTEAGTIYLGTFDAFTGTLKSKYAMVDMGDLEWSFVQPSSSIPYGTFFAYIRPPAGALKAWGVDNFICEIYKYATSWSADKSFKGNSANQIAYVVDSSFNGDVSAFTQAVDGYHFCYELADTKTYNLTQISTFNLALGSNNLWCDTGDSDLEYYAKE